MTRKLKVYAGNDFVNGKQSRVFVATTSWKRVSEIFGSPVSYLRAYWSITGNAIENKIALASPEKPFYMVGDVSTTPTDENIKQYIK